MDNVATAEPTTEQPAEIEEFKPLGINKTNIATALHHYEMALKSLHRAYQTVWGMSLNDTGAGKVVVDTIKTHMNAENSIGSVTQSLTDLDDQRKAFFG